METVHFDFSKLIGRIVEKYKTQTAFAKVIGMNPSTLSYKLNNINSFTTDEIYNICLLLEINPNKINEYFFTVEVRK